MIKCVLSDLGNVVLSFDISRFYRKISESSPYRLDQIGRIVDENSKLLKDYGTGKIEPKEFYERASRELKTTADYESFFAAYDDVFILKPDVVKILRKLKTKCRLILLSNTDVEHFGFIRRKFPEMFFFDDYVLSYEVGWMKPDPEIYRIALERAKAKAGECVFIDDLEENVEAAAKLGLHTILFRPQTALESELCKLNLLF